MTDTDSAPIVYLPDGTPVKVRLIGATCEGDVSGEGHYGYYPQDLDGEDLTVYFERVPSVECVHCDDEIAQAFIEEHHVTEHPMERWNPAYYPEVFEDDELRADGGVTVFEDGEATTCPDCRGELEYQNRVAMLCLDCGEQFDHFYSSVKHELCTTGDDGDLETVATAPVDDKELVTDGGADIQTVDDTLFEVVKKRTDPTPDGVTNAEGNIWTGETRLKQEASKGNVPCSRDELGDAVERLIDDGRLISWHGLLAPVTDEHLTAIIENERKSTFTRKILIRKVNKIRGEMR